MQPGRLCIREWPGSAAFFLVGRMLPESIREEQVKLAFMEHAARTVLVSPSAPLVGRCARGVLTSNIHYDFP